MASSTFFDRVKVGVASAPGTGVISLGSATPGFRSFVGAGVPDGALVSYVIEDAANFEVGQGTYAKSANTLSRTTIYVTSASDGKSAIMASASASVYITVTAADLLALAASATLAAAGVLTAPKVVQHAQNNTQGNPVSTGQAGAGPSVTMPSVPVAGNLLVAIVHQYGNVATPNTGWTQLVTGAADGNNHHRVIYSKIVAAGDTALQTPMNSAQNCLVQIYEVSSYNADDFNGTAIPNANVTASSVRQTDMIATLKAVPASSVILGLISSDANQVVNVISSVLQDESYNGYIGDYSYDIGFRQPVSTAGDVTVEATSPNTNYQCVAMIAVRGKAASAGSTASTTPAAPTYTTAYTTYLIQFTALGPKKPDYMSFAEISMVDKNGNKQTPSSVFSNEGPFLGNSGYSIQNAIDGDLTTFYASADANLPQSVALNFPTAFVAGGVTITCRNGDDFADQTPTAFMVSGSNDGGSSYAAASGALTLPTFSSASQVQTATIS